MRRRHSSNSSSRSSSRSSDSSSVYEKPEKIEILTKEPDRLKDLNLNYSALSLEWLGTNIEISIIELEEKLVSVVPK